MKKILIALALILPTTVYSQVATETVYNCNFWTNQNGYYVCSSYPFSKQVIEPMSLNMKIRDLEKRISDLEAKLEAALEKIN